MLIFLGCIAGISAQSAFIFGVEAGAALNVVDYDRLAIRDYKIKYEMEDVLGFQAMQTTIGPPIIAAIFFGFDVSKYAGFRTGIDFYINVKDEFATTLYDKKVMTYKYSFLTIPLLANIYFLNTRLFRMGVSLGPYFSIPLGDIERTAPEYGTKPAQSGSIPQNYAAGFQAALLSELKLPKGAITLSIGYNRDLWTGYKPMIFSSDTTIPNSSYEQKLTIFQGIAVKLGYKFSILMGAPAAEKDESDGNDDQPVYYRVVGTEAEGPLSINDLKSLYQRSILRKDTQLWKDGLGNWQEAQSFPELGAIFGASQ